MYCPYFVSVVTQRQSEEAIDPRLRAAGCQLCSASAHLFGGIFVFPGEGNKHTIIPLRETIGKNHHRALNDQVHGHWKTPTLLPCSLGNRETEGMVWEGSSTEQGGYLKFMLCSEPLISHSDQLCGNENKRK